LDAVELQVIVIVSGDDVVFDGVVEVVAVLEEVEGSLGVSEGKAEQA
jgi:hypothetical protein